MSNLEPVLEETIDILTDSMYPAQTRIDKAVAIIERHRTTQTEPSDTELMDWLEDQDGPTFRRFVSVATRIEYVEFISGGHIHKADSIRKVVAAAMLAEKEAYARIGRKT